MRAHIFSRASSLCGGGGGVSLKRGEKKKGKGSMGKKMGTGRKGLPLLSCADTEFVPAE